jgi:tetrahydrodipicolinate N-succinyltransferase
MIKDGVAVGVNVGVGVGDGATVGDGIVAGKVTSVAVDTA